MRAALLALLVACGPEPSPESGHIQDLRQYAKAAGSADPVSCVTIMDLKLQAECRSMAAAEQARLGELDAAEDTCKDLHDHFWKDECRFLVADAIGARGEAVKRWCGKAGRLKNQCHTHAFDRELAESRAELVPGEEAAFEVLLAERFAAFVPEARAEAAARDMVAILLAEASQGQPFSPETCGGALPETCIAIYVARVEEWVQRDQCLGNPDGQCPLKALAPVCEGTVAPGAIDREAAIATGIPAWTPEAEVIVVQAWERLCDPKAQSLHQGNRGAGG